MGYLWVKDMPTRGESKQIARTRLKEAKALFDKRLYDGSCYLAGYVVELALKAKICKTLNIDEYPDSGEISRSFKTHNLDQLLKLSGLEKKLDKEKAKNPVLEVNWSLVTTWSEQLRYNPIGTSKRQNAIDMINALEDQNNGVFIWIKKRW